MPAPPGQMSEHLPVYHQGVSRSSPILGLEAGHFWRVVKVRTNARKCRGPRSRMRPLVWLAAFLGGSLVGLLLENYGFRHRGIWGAAAGSAESLAHESGPFARFCVHARRTAQPDRPARAR